MLKSRDIEAMIKKLFLHLSFTKSLKHDNVYKLFMTPRRIYMPNINTLACCKACDIELRLENMNLSYLAQNHSSVTRLK